MTARSTKVFGLEIRYIDAGAGSTLILLHGLANDGTMWLRIVHRLAAHHRVIVPDQIGFGRSAKPIIPYRIGTFSDFLAAFCRNLGITTTALAGHSFGGWVAASAAIAYPALVRQLILIDSIGLKKKNRENVLSRLELGTLESVRQLMPILFADPTPFLEDDVIEALFAQRMATGDGWAVSRALDFMAKEEGLLDASLSQIACPTLIVWGKEDRLTPVSDAARFARGIANSELQILDRCGHMPPLERSQEFCDTLLRYLDKHSAPPGAGPAAGDDENLLTGRRRLSTKRE